MVLTSDKESPSVPGKYVYYFSPTGAEGSAKMKNILGGKGAAQGWEGKDLTAHSESLLIRSGVDPGGVG